MLTLVLLNIGWQEILLIALVILLIFGGAKLPQLMRGMGQGVKEFKDAVNGKEDKKEEQKEDKKEEK